MVPVGRGPQPYQPSDLPQLLDRVLVVLIIDDQGRCVLESVYELVQFRLAAENEDILTCRFSSVLFIVIGLLQGVPRPILRYEEYL